MEKKYWAISGGALLILMVAAAAFLIYKLGRQSVYIEKWQEYDDYGWS